MLTLIVGSLVLSILHALIPNHWLPVLAISKRERWTLAETSAVTLMSGLSHAFSTVILGLMIALVGFKLSEEIGSFSHVISPIILISIGIFYVYQHHRHKHFHLHEQRTALSKKQVIVGLAVAMFFSPCFEVEAYFLLAGAHGWFQVTVLSLLYTTVTVLGMVVWVRIAYKGMQKFNWHSLEHNSGIITGVTLVITGIASFFIQ